MPIVFAAITPHPPVLIKEIGKDHIEEIKKTQAALKSLEQDFYAAKPDTVLIIAEHGKVLPDAFNINLNSDYLGGFKEFGDFGVEFKFRSDYMTIQNIRAGDEMHKTVPITLTSEKEISHGFSVPLHYLTKHLKDLPIVPVTTSELDYQKHFEFGQFLHNQIAKLDKRMAVIASADLSHKLTKEGPAGYSAKAADFDKQVIGLIEKKDVTGLLKLSPKLVDEVGHSEVKSIITFFGVLDSIATEPKLLSYEGPFGVGYAVVNFEF